jgi:hypothetical protein
MILRHRYDGSLTPPDGWLTWCHRRRCLRCDVMIRCVGTLWLASATAPPMGSRATLDDGSSVGLYVWLYASAGYHTAGTGRMVAAQPAALGHGAVLAEQASGPPGAAQP